MPRSDPSAFLKNPKGGKVRLRVSSRTSNIRKVSARILGSVSALHLDEGTVFDIKLCIEEAVRNAMVHGNRSNKRLPVRISYGIDNSRLVIEVEDAGRGFDHAKVADPTEEPHITKNSGRGVYLIKKLMDKAEYNAVGNKLTMVKNLAGHKPISKRRGDTMPMHIENKDGLSVCHVDGEIDINSSPAIKKSFDRLLSARTPKIVVNLSKVTYVDSSGLATLVEILKNMRSYGGKLRLTNLSSKVRNLFEITKLEKLFEIMADEQDAISSLA